MNLSVGQMTWSLGVAGVGLLVLRTLLGVADSNLVLMRRSRLRPLTEEGDERAQRLEQVLDERHAVHASLSLCRSAMSVLLGAIAVWVPDLQNLGPGVQGLSLGLTVLLTLFTEMAARRVAWNNPEKMGLGLVPFYSAVRRLTQPVLRPLSALASGVAGLFGSRPSAEVEDGVTEDEIRLMVEAGRDIEESEKEMINSIFELSETIAREIMVPRVDVVAVEKGTPIADVLDRCLEKGLSRLPVYDQTVDNVVGLVSAKDLVARVREGRADGMLVELLRPALFVPASKRVDELMREMQRDKVAMAIVVDEYGGTDGLLTMEDLIEEIVGEITDEYDEDEPSVEVRPDGSVVLDAGMIIEDVNELLGTSFPADEYETIGGFVYGQLGHAPRKGDRAQCEGLVVSAEHVRGQRITRVWLARVDGLAFTPDIEPTPRSNGHTPSSGAPSAAESGQGAARGRS